MIKFLDVQAINARHLAEINARFAVVQASGHFLNGPMNEAFCRDFAAYCGVKHALGVANGLDALRLIIAACGFGPGDEIIVPANTFIASILAISQNGCTPVPVEPSPETYNLDPARVEEAVTSHTRAILAVHLYGRTADMEPLWALAGKYHLRLIEDGAQAHGARYQGHRVGGLGDVAGFSFYPGKNLGAMGDGGGITTNDDALYERLKVLANYGSDCKYHHILKGFNSRLDELQAAVLDVKLAHLDEDNAHRRAVAERYLTGIRNPLVTLPQRSKDREGHVWHLFVTRTPGRDLFQRHLEERGIETLIHYPTPPHRQEAYAEWSARSYPVTDRIHEEALSLPISPVMPDNDVDAVIDAVNAFRDEAV